MSCSNCAPALAGQMVAVDKHNNCATCGASVTFTPPSDPGAHYRYEYRGIKFDPYRAARIWDITDHALFSAFKKVAHAGRRGNKNAVADVKDAINALERWLEMNDEDQHNHNEDLIDV